MAKDFAEAFYHSKAWRLTRNYYFKKMNGICERCHGEYGPGEIVHHKIWLTPYNINNPSITLGEDNLEVVCRVCHALEHEGQMATDKNLMFDDEGNLIERKDQYENHNSY